jgi:DEAD/DEAH box helicase domain-containing protein
MDETINWLQNRPYYRRQINAQQLMDGREGTYADLDVESLLSQALDRRGIDQFYQHQATAIETIRDGENIVIATPTASGKSLTYTIPAVERALDHDGRTLYIAPLRALINDQEENLTDLTNDLGMNANVGVGQYTGQLSTEQKRTVRGNQPHIVLMTPDLLHYGVLPHDHLWEWFFRQLDTIVIDEVHEYRGIFGSQIALLMRRLSRMCDRYNTDPQFICCSATIGNPAEHAGNVTGQPTDSFTVIEEDTSTTGATHWLFWNPPPVNNDSDDSQPAAGELESTGQPPIMTSDGGEVLPASSPPSMDTDEPPNAEPTPASKSETDDGAVDGGDATTETSLGPETGGERKSNHAESVRLFCDLVTSGYQTLVFTRTRQGAERCADWCAAKLHKWGEHEAARSITAYQAALKQDRREEIEDGLHDGSIPGVWSTSALELGVDVGGLDVVILDGYPGTRMQTHQRAGRAGRGRDASLVTLVGGRDQLDQYLMGHPDVFFDGDPETAAVNPANDQLMPDHVLSAATESWLSPADEQHFGEEFPALVADLEAADQLDRRNTQHGLRWTYAGEESPQHQMDLRAIDDRQIQIRDRLGDETLASLPYDDALRDVHPNAIYYHQGEKYEVVDLDLHRNIAFLESTDLSYYTQALTDKAISVNEVLDETTLDTHPGVSIGFADVDFREQVTKYLRCTRGNDNGEPIPLVEPLPPTELRTRALYFTIPPAIKQNLKAESDTDDGFEGAIHAVEHAMISLFPLEFLCDRRDIGGLSTPLHPQTAKSTIFIYDGYPGGVGLARGGYERVEDLLRETREVLADCPCESGCPACVQSPHCGNANDPLDKGLALSLLDLLLDNADRNADQVAVDTGMDTESLAPTENESDTDASVERTDRIEGSSQANNDTPICAETDGEDADHDSDSGSGTSPEERDQTSIAEQIAAQTGTDTRTVVDALDSLDSYGVEPEVAKSSLLERYGADGSTIYSVSGIGHIRGHYLLEAGYDTPKTIAAASVDDLMDVPYLAEATAPAVHDEAQKYVERTRNEN